MERLLLPRSHYSTILLLWVHFTRSRLSLNIIREIADYIGSEYLFPCLIGAQFRLYDLKTGSFVLKPTQKQLDSGAVLCLVTDHSIACIGSQPPSVSTLLFDLKTYSYSDLPPMTQARTWPGVLLFSEEIYVFGGNFDPSLTSSERFPLNSPLWTSIGHMQSAKVLFSPCGYGEEIYLAAANSSGDYFEAFCPNSCSFRLVLLTMFVPCYGSVAWVEGSCLYVIGANRDFGRVDLREEKWEKEVEKVKLKQINSVTSRITPVVVGKEVYWLNYWDGALVRFSLDTLVIKEFQ